MKESQVVPELVEERAGAGEGGADELVPHPERDHRVGAKVCDARRTRRHVVILVHGHGARSSACSETRLVTTRVQTRKRRSGLAPGVGEQNVMEQTTAF